MGHILNSFASYRLLMVVLTTCVFFSACGKKQSGENGKSKETVVSGELLDLDESNSERASLQPDDLRSGYEQDVSFIRTSKRSEMRLGGLYVDFGTGDEHKYIRGGWESGWDLANKDAKNKKSVLPLEKGGWINTFLWTSPNRAEVSVHCSKAGQTIVLKNGKEKFSQACTKEGWNTLAFAFEDKEYIDRQRWHLSHDGAKPVLLDWLWFAEGTAEKPNALPFSTGPLRLSNGVRRSMLSPNDQSYTFYLQPQKEHTLIFDYGAKKEAVFSVDVKTSDGQVKNIFKKTSSSEWQTSEISLAEFADKPIALIFGTNGEATGAGWGEPGLFVKADESEGKNKGDFEPAKNLVMIVLDTTRADSFEAFKKGNPIKTPFFDSFQKKSLTFTSAYNNGNWTKPSVTSLLSGLTAMTHGATKPASKVPEKAKLLPEYLKGNGFDTIAFSANPVVGPAHGFDKGWDSMTVYEHSEGDGHAMYNRAADWVKTRKEDPDRFFMFIQTIDAHTTYAPPRSYSKPYHKEGYSGIIGNGFTREEQRDINEKKLKVDDKDKAWIDALYKGEVTYQDEKMGVLLSAMKAEGLLENTIVIVTNDHGEEVFDHGTIGHGWQLYEEMIRAPLLIHHPTMFGSDVISKSIEHVDVAPTLMEALGLPAMRNIDGESFFRTIRKEQQTEGPITYAVSMSDNGKRTVVSDQWKLIVHRTKGWIGLFDIKSESAEFKDLRSQAPMVGRMLEILFAEAMVNPSKLSRFSGQVGQRLASPTMNLDPKTKAQLEALGYL